MMAAVRAREIAAGRPARRRPARPRLPGLAWWRALFRDPFQVPPPTRPRLILLVPSLPSDVIGGAQIQAERMAAELAGGLDVVVMARAVRCPSGLEDRGRYRVLRRPVLSLPWLPVEGLRGLVDVLLCLWQIGGVRRGARAIVAYQTLFGGLAAALTGRWYGVASVVFIRGEFEYRASIESPVRRLLSRFAWSLADRVLLQSSRMVEPFLARAEGAGVERAGLAEKVGVVANGVEVPDLDRPRPAAPDGDSDADAEARLVFVGRLHPIKGLDVLLAALRSIEPAHRPRVTLVGDGPLRASLEADARDLPVRLAGELARESALAEVAGADVLVFPAVGGDGMPNAVMEAMALGLAVIATPVAAVPDLIRHEENGLLVPPGDAAALRDAILRLTGDPALRASLGAQARLDVTAMSWANARRRLTDEIAVAVRAAGSRGARAPLSLVRGAPR